ncbi:hypothetical protein Tco_0519164 [Tanacetum coccineum]
MTMPSTIEEKTCKKNDVKARSLLLMALPNEHQLTFDQYVDAQSMFAAIKARFGGNEATKKTHKALLKQQYENFSALSSESLDSIFNRLQRLVSRLANRLWLLLLPKINEKFLMTYLSELDTQVVEYFNCHKMGHFAREYRAPRSKDNINWNKRHCREGNSANMVLMAFSRSRENDAPIIEDWVSDDEDDDEPNPKVEKKTVIPTATQKEYVKPEKPVKSYPNQQRKRIVSGNNYNKKDNDYYSKTSHSSAQKHMDRAFLKEDCQKSVNNCKTLLILPFRSTVNTVRARGFNAVKPSACWVWRPIKPNGASLSNSQLNDKGFVDSGCSRHMTGNIAHLLDFKDFDGGYVTFGGGAYGGRITGKGTIKTDNLDFDDVYFVKELKFNLFSVSQMCDKKNYVLFTDSECLVLSPNFKLPDENQILLKIPRQDNMYSFDMKNIVPKDSLTCLVAKATSEESMLWHKKSVGIKI